MRIYLVGYMGAGKTTFGKRLARHLQWTHFDLDQQIEQQLGKSVESIVNESGMDFFRSKEREVLESTASLEKSVISTGGGAPTANNNMDWMNQQGLTVYLKTTAEALYSRLKNGTAERPLLKGLEAFGLLDFIRTHLEQREPFYQKAQFEVDSLKIKSMDLDAWLATLPIQTR